MGPSKLYLQKLNSVLNDRRFSKVDDLDGFKGDVDSCFDLEGRGTPFRLMQIAFTHDDLSRLIAEFEVIDQLSWAEIKKEILRIWNDEVAYKHSEFEFTEDSSGQTFHFFTYEDEESLFVTGKLIFRRS